MKCAIRFCGGCNCGYNRGKVYKQIVNEFPQVNFLIASEDDIYDFLIVFGGCSSCCASYEQYNVKGDVLKIWSDEHIDDIIDNIKNILETSQSTTETENEQTPEATLV